ncbi:hypothetical protein [Pseudomonas sp. UMAB-40]|uniref:hypothetical protein n=1 Tax=Pseudomonas sp. UMAB-40 TaxID=1365407 RepID=UPI001C5A00B8|nr:hypothetical protein [Pseudomonas sp. UMAB-40]
MSKITTRVYQLPADDVARDKFVTGLKALEEECGVTFISGSMNDEMGYADLLATELAEHIGEMGVEDMRQKFERAARDDSPAPASDQPQ